MKKNAFRSPLSRPLDFRYRSNVLVAVLAVFSALAATIYNSLATEPLSSPSWVVGGAVFLAWAIARELDPDDNRSAAAAGVIGAIVAVTGRPSLVLALGVLMGLRLIAGTVGVAMRWTDVAAVVGVGAFLGLRSESLIAVPILIAGVIIGGRLRRPVWVAVAVLAASASAFLVAQPESTWTDLTAWTGALVGAAVLAVPLLIVTKDPRSLPDSGRGEISRHGVLLARSAAVLGIVGSLLLGGGGGVFAAGTIVAGVVGVSSIAMLSARTPVPALQAARSQS